MGKLVDESLQEKLVLRSSHGRPRPGRNVRFPQMIVELLVRGEIWKFMQASENLLVTGIVFVHADNASSPRGGHPVRSQGSAEPRHSHGAIVAVARRFLPAPDDLDRASPQLLGNRGGLAHIVLVSAPPEAAAQEAVVEVNLLQRNSGYFRCIDRGVL